MAAMKFVALWTAIGAWIALELWLRFRDASAGYTHYRASSDRGSGLILIVCLGIGIVLDVSLSRSSSDHALVLRDGALFWVGIACMWLGIALRLWAVLTLGRFFRLVVTIQEGHHVVDNGPYHLLRHPSYSGALLTLVGFGLASSSWAGFVLLMVFCAAGFWARIRVEERTLRASLGDAYVRYSGRTRRLVPFVW